MPSIKKRICNKCKNIVDSDHNCRDKTADKIYNKVKRENHEFYTSRTWRKKRDYIMSIHGGLCQDCLDIGITEVARVVDHVIELKDNWDLRLDDDNLRPLCQTCHNRKTFTKD